jgi:hypothetical protein
LFVKINRSQAVAYYSHKTDPGDEGDFDRMRDLFGPGQVDQQIRQAVHFCWMALPKQKRSIDEVERQIRRLVDRAIRDLREDFDEFSGEGGAK